jgi:stearoyl-CoA desaturase (Delta-9 desaturase)
MLNSLPFDLTSLIDTLAGGALDWPVWKIILFTLAMTHITMVSVTIFLHRHQAHRSLDLHPIAAHFFRFWLWLTTGQVTKEWAAVHRKHHAKCEQAEDPHSPHVFGIKTVLTQGRELYAKEAQNQETLKRYGHGTPDDWIENHVYAPHSRLGVALMLGIDLVLFGPAGLAAWAVQMAWTPVMAAGVINGLAHFWGYRNFEVADASTNISPWGILIAGEELHNNHHTYPTSAKLSVKKGEFDIGWMYIRALQACGMATPKKTPPKLVMGSPRTPDDEKNLDALIANRHEIMASYAAGIRRMVRQEMRGAFLRSANSQLVLSVKRWMHRDREKIPAPIHADLAKARAACPVLDKMLAMREELKSMWLNTSASKEKLCEDLHAWCIKAEASGIVFLKEFSFRLRAAQA